jgi:phage gpG-like protein
MKISRTTPQLDRVNRILTNSSERKKILLPEFKEIELNAKKLTTSGVDYRKRKFTPLRCSNRKPLNKTGSLINSIRLLSNNNDKYQVKSDPKYRIHQYGGIVNNPKPFFCEKLGHVIKLKRAIIPRRPFLPIDTFGKPDIDKTLLNNIRKNIKTKIIG